jgi:putative tryptophan/tyrosine transport system substrate-binding protein
VSGNITGLTNFNGLLAAKWLEVLRDVIPRLMRVAVIWNPQSAGIQTQVAGPEAAGRQLGIRVDV